MSRQCIGQIGRLALAAVCVLVVWGRPAPAHGAAEQIELPPYKAPLKDDSIRRMHRCTICRVERWSSSR